MGLITDLKKNNRSCLNGAVVVASNEEVMSDECVEKFEWCGKINRS